MMDMGYMPKKADTILQSEAPEPKKQYPRLYIDKKIPQEIMNKDIGEMCRLEIIGKIVSKSMDERNGENIQRTEIEIHKMGYIGQVGKLTKEEYLKRNDDEREEYDKEQVKEQVEENDE